MLMRTHSQITSARDTAGLIPFYAVKMKVKAVFEKCWS